MQLVIKQATLEQNRDLLEQYFELRQDFFDKRELELRASGKIPKKKEEEASEEAKPKWPIRGDSEAEFLLVVDMSDSNAPRVRGGMRLSKYRDGVENPSDNALKNAPEILFPRVENIRTRKNILFTDGAAFIEDRSLGKVIDALLGGIATKARQDKADAVLMIPSTKFETQVWAYFDPKPRGYLRRLLPPEHRNDKGEPTVIPITNFGKITYTNRIPMEVTKSLLGIIEDEELKRAALPLPPTHTAIKEVRTR